MYVDELTVSRSMATPLPQTTGFGWFAARQPGILRFLEDRLRSDAFAVALAAAWKLVAAFHRHDGVPPARVATSLLERAEEAVTRESHDSVDRGTSEEGCVARQPVLVAWVADLVSSPPVPLHQDERRDLGLALTAIIYALDEVTTGRAVPEPRLL